MIEFRQVRKAYLGVGDDALRDVTLHIPRGAFAVVLGASGAGKTTLLRLAAGIERPSAGDVRVGDLSLATLSERALRWARRNMGLTFQDLKMLDDRTALDNVRLPLDYLGMPRDDATRRARAALDKVGLREREGFYPRMMSGGEQQRLAIARAIVHRPAVLLADEPTANLDRENAVRVVELLTAFSRVGTTVVVATHDETAFAAVANQCIALRAGRVIDAVGAVSEAG